MTNPPFSVRPTGFFPLFSQHGALTALLWQKPVSDASPAEPNWQRPVFLWLEDYFQGRFRIPDFPLDPQGSPFQKRVWHRLLAIPPGRTETYGTVARDLRTSPRAVGQGVGTNPIPIVIPCHRVVAATGMGGYSAPGGTASKQWLLLWESHRSRPDSQAKNSACQKQ